MGKIKSFIEINKEMIKNWQTVLLKGEYSSNRNLNWNSSPSQPLGHLNDACFLSKKPLWIFEKNLNLQNRYDRI